MVLDNTNSLKDCVAVTEETSLLLADDCEFPEQPAPVGSNQSQAGNDNQPLEAPADVSEEKILDFNVPIEAVEFTPPAPEKTHEGLLRLFDNETLEGARHELETLGRDPRELVLEAVRDNRVVCFGEKHVTPNPQRDFGKEVMQDIADAGITHLALEIPITTRSTIEKFMQTGKMDVEKLPDGLRHDDYIGLLHAARDAGLKLVPVDRERPGLEMELRKYPIGGSHDHTIRQLQSELQKLGDRDTHMAKGIMNILDQSPDNKVALWVGSEHLNDPEGRGRNLVVEQLRDTHKVDVAAFLDEGYHDPGTVLHELSRGVDSDVAISLEESNHLGGLTTNGSHPDYSDRDYRNWDNVIIYPSRSEK